jgi:hypothetical protein
MRDGFKVIDADRHVLEPSDLYARYLPEKFRAAWVEGPNQTFRYVDGERVPTPTSGRVAGQRLRRHFRRQSALRDSRRLRQSLIPRPICAT